MTMKYNYTKKTGRPPEYNETTCDKAREYINSCIDVVNKQGKLLEVNLPTAAGLAIYLGVVKQTLYRWGEEHVEFSSVLKELNQAQEKKLIDNGVSGRYNSNITKLVLGKHGYKEQMGLSGEEEGEGIKIDVNINDTIERIYRSSSQSNTEG